MPFRVRAALAALVTALACAGCSFGPGAGSGVVKVRVTRDFGAHTIKSVTVSKAGSSENQLSLLQRHFSVTTKEGGFTTGGPTTQDESRSVASINGHSGTGGHSGWFYYVNGVQPKKGAALQGVHKGDQIWWDLHDWQRTKSIPAVVGSFPEPFLHGINGQRYPTTLECGSDVQSACNTVTKQIRGFKIPVSSQLIGTGSGPDTLGIVVGTWKEVHPQVAAEMIAYGPGSSGVFATFTKDGSHLRLLNEAGKVVRTLGPGAGLIAATADQSSVPTWLVTGTDAAGVRAAARAFNTGALADHFALAVDGSAHYPVPLPGTR